MVVQFKKLNYFHAASICNKELIEVIITKNQQQSSVKYLHQIPFVVSKSPPNAHCKNCKNKKMHLVFRILAMIELYKRG